MARRDWTKQEIIDETIRQANAAGVDAAVVLGVFEQESGFDETIVGDGGDSFGLRQLNVHGQLAGHTSAWAFDPLNAIPDAIRAFKGVTTATAATAKQNPADWAGYTAKLTPRIAKWRAALKGKATPAAPAAGGAIKQVIGPLDGPAADHMDHVHVAGYGAEDDPTIAAVVARAKSHGLSQTSGERQTKFTASGNVSDHWVGSKDTWARDFGGSMDAMLSFNTEMRGLVGKTPDGAAGGDMVKAVDLIPGDLPDFGSLWERISADLVKYVAMFLLLIVGLVVFTIGVVKMLESVPGGDTVTTAAKMAVTKGAAGKGGGAAK